MLWALENTKHYTLGNPNLIVATDHKPLVKLFGDKRLGDIPNPRLARLKEGTLRWDFKVIHIPGKLNFGADALSRQQQRSVDMVGVLPREVPSQSEQQSSDEMETELVAWAEAGLPELVSWSMVKDKLEEDNQLMRLRTQVKQGFPPDRKLVTVELREFWRHREELSLVDGGILFKGRVVVPQALRKAVLETLHSAHQGVYGMLLVADKSVWWPGMAADVRQVRQQCHTNDEIAPSQQKGIPTTPDSPVYPFQQICADHFTLRGWVYLVIVDRFSGWPLVTYCGTSSGSSKKVIEVLRDHFGRYGVPEELATDGALNFTGYEVESFLEKFGVKHRVSSAMFPQSNMRAELGVRSMKRLCRENTSACGTLDSGHGQISSGNTDIQEYSRQGYWEIPCGSVVWKEFEGSSAREGMGVHSQE